MAQVGKVEPFETRRATGSAQAKLRPISELQFQKQKSIALIATARYSKRKRRDVWMPLKRQAPYATVISMIVAFLIFLSTVQVPVPVEQEPTEDYYIDKGGHVIQKTEKDTRPSPVPTLGYASPRAPAGWSDDLLLSEEPDVSSEPSVGVNGDFIHIVWEGAKGAQPVIYYRNSTDGGQTWNHEKVISIDDGSPNWHPKVTVSGSSVHVVWDNFISATGRFETYYSRSDDGGGSWTPEISISDNNNAHSRIPSIAVNGSNVYVVWHDFRDSDYEIYFDNSSDNGNTWYGNRRLTTSMGDSYSPRIAVNKSILHLTWYDDRFGNMEIFYKNSTDSGLSWSNDVRLTNTIDDSIEQDISVYGNYVHIVWRDYRDGNWEIYYINSSDSGLSWSDEQRLTYNVDDSYQASIVVDSISVHIVWIDNRDGYEWEYEVYFKNSTDNGISWSSDLKLTTSVNRTALPDITVSNGCMHVVFADNRTGNNEIYYKRSPPTSPPIIPEFEMILIPMATIIALFIIYRRKSRS